MPYGGENQDSVYTAYCTFCYSKWKVLKSSQSLLENNVYGIFLHTFHVL